MTLTSLCWAPGVRVARIIMSPDLTLTTGGKNVHTGTDTSIRSARYALTSFCPGAVGSDVQAEEASQLVNDTIQGIGAQPDPATEDSMISSIQVHTPHESGWMTSLEACFPLLSRPADPS